MLRFRPLWKLTIAAAILFASLVALGFWQLDRLQWKLNLIAQVNRNMAAPPITLGEARVLGSAADYHRVAIDGAFDNTKEAYVFGTGADGAAVYHVIVPFTTRTGETLLVDRGIVPKEWLDPATRRAGQPAGRRHIVGVWRTPERPGWFTPQPDLEHRVWYARDPASIAHALHVRLAGLAIVEADGTPNPGGWPKGGQTAVRFRNEHLQYAVTWFALALVLLAVYVAYHVSRGRLEMGP
ncbi:MAG TPA: SURF1 family protein [Rhizomicrobium sp.]|jgi:surfeit locus 1 family protein|nr:SURF1 family protein [Rhizomicrobium sp.]